MQSNSLVVKKLSLQIPSLVIKHRLIDRFAYSGDAAFYQMTPLAVVQPKNIDEIKSLFQFSQQEKIPLVFRTGGTSLCGQCITDGLLADLSMFWRKAEVMQDGGLVKVQPGIIGAHVNRKLLPFQKKIGPDPASINAAMMGGILSNNSSGMCCGVVQNSYHTLHSIAFMLTNGLYFDTSVADDYKRFETEAAELYNGLLQLKKKLMQNEVLVQLVRKKYRLKNTVGYSINAFVDYEHPLDVFAHLLIGAEGTLAFIAEAVLNTVPDNAYKATGLLYFQNAATASDAVQYLKESGAEALELMDREALRSIEQHPDAPALIATLDNEATAILCEYQAGTSPLLQQKMDAALPVINNLPLLYKAEFTEDVLLQTKIWKLRKGMYPSVAAARASNTTMLLEDVAFPAERLGEAITDMQLLMKKHGYHNGIIFGHAKEGNLHFVISQALHSKEAIETYEAFAQELAEIVCKKYNGSLKAEHGTGRQIAPFIEDEWGKDAYEIMQSVKQLADPHNLLNPGVIINADKDCHIKNLKKLTQVEPEVNKCIECGFCENRCPSRDFTLTPRQRIAVRRAIKHLDETGETAAKKELLKQYQYDAIDTCATDGMCAIDCPVSINTGELVKRLRKENHSGFSNAVALWTAKNFSFISAVTRAVIKTATGINKIFGTTTVSRISKTLSKIFPHFPQWNNYIQPAKKIKTIVHENADVIFFTSCINRIMGNAGNEPSGTEMFLSLAKKAGIHASTPKHISALCCSQVYSSKGFYDAQKFIAGKTIEQLWHQSNEGKIPIVTDFTSCTLTLQQQRPYLSHENQQRFDAMKIIDIIPYLHQYILPGLQIAKKKKRVALHPVCSVHKTGTLHELQQIAKACAEEVLTPLSAGCCGMAGDRGFYYPGLTKAATAAEANELQYENCDGYYSSAKTCELAMSQTMKKNYQNVLQLVYECAR